MRRTIALAALLTACGASQPSEPEHAQATSSALSPLLDFEDTPALRTEAARVEEGLRRHDIRFELTCDARCTLAVEEARWQEAYVMAESTIRASHLMLRLAPHRE